VAQAIYGMGVIVGPTRPTIGGYIVDRFSWPYIFYINIPLGIIATFDSKLCKKSKIWRKTEVESSRLARNYSSGIFHRLLTIRTRAWTTG
jgi:MFS family permease